MQQAAISDINPRDLLTMTAEVHIADSATLSAATRWTALGNVPGLQYQPNAENKKTMANIRGLKRPLKSHTTGIDPKYEVTVNELRDDVLDMIFFVDTTHDFGSGGADNAQTGLSAAAGTAFDFDAGDDGVAVAAGERVDILNASGGHVTHVTAIVLTGVNLAYGPDEDQAALVEGVDYELDGDVGQIRFLKAINDDVISTSITSETITAVSSNYMIKRKPNRIGYIERMCRIFWWDQDNDSNWVIWHKDFKARFSVSDGFNADGEADAEAKLEIEILTDGEIWKRV